MKKRWIVAGAFAAFLGGVALFNAPFWARPEGGLSLLAHRGVHQRFSTEGLDNETCTAARIHAPTHAFLENTIPAIEAAFAAGAGMVEIDIHPTTDGEFAVFHDWTLDCRTNGAGITRRQTMAHLRTLDVGHGYTADGGASFPFRGQGVGLMPSLRDVLARFPGRRFLINFKGNDPAEADALSAYLRRTPGADPARLAFWGARPADRLRELHPNWRIASRKSLMACARAYMLIGWAGQIPGECRDTILYVPVNYGFLLWGWPNLFLARMREAGSEVVIVGPIDPSNILFTGIDDEAGFAAVPHDWRGGVATDAVEVIGPLAARRAP